MINLSKEQLYELKKIMGDPYKNGPFAGMITNLVFENPEESFESIVRTALNVRIELQEAAGRWVKPE